MTQRFVPLTRGGMPYRVTAVLFDFDGTLTRPELIDFVAIRRAVGCPEGVGLLEYFRDVESVDERRRYEAILERAEADAADRAETSVGASELVAFLRGRGIPMGIITRNAGSMVERSLRRMGGISPEDFGAIVSRDLPVSPKPHPGGVFRAAELLGVSVSELLLVGDHAFDVEAGRTAGALTMFVRNKAGVDVMEARGPAAGDDNEARGSTAEGGRAEASVAGRPTVDTNADFVVDDLGGALGVIRYGLSLPVGKLPVEFLSEGLSEIVIDDPSVLVGAGIGEDAAALDIRPDEVLVLASDPITLAMDSLARYVVLTNANDVATSGAEPRWLLTTLMFPPGSSASEVVALVGGIQRTCGEWGISLCGGHTEITDAVARPLAVGMMAGTAPAGGLLDKSMIRAGDLILLSKGVAVEGTGLIAREYPARLAEEGMSEEEIARCAGFLDRIGILEEARICRGTLGVTSLHDVTEGGLATAVRELASAAGVRVRVDVGEIPVYPETRRVCEALGLDPLGLIGSGSLLITCDRAGSMVLKEAFTAEGIPVAEIGRVIGPGEGVEAFSDGRRVDWPCFERDEVSRLVR